MIYVTGDTHARFNRFTMTSFPEQEKMTKKDYVIIVGDFGGIFSTDENDKTEKWWLDWLEEKPFTTLFICGNHENFDRLDAYPIEEWHGGKVHKIRPSIIHLMRGQVFDIDGKTFFTFGGASSHDVRDGILEIGDKRIKEWKYDRTKFFRVNHVSWWQQEMPNDEERKEGLENLEKHNFKVDFILTHDGPSSIIAQMGNESFNIDRHEKYLQTIMEKTDYSLWIFGHMHVEQVFMAERCVCTYFLIKRLV